MELSTKSLRMEIVQPKHLSQIFEIWTDPENGRYMRDSTWGSVDELKVILEQDDEYYSFVACLHGQNRVVATCNIQRDESFTDGTWTIGYNVRKDCWRRGFASEMVMALIDFARTLGATSIETGAATVNVPSCKLLEKCGFTLDKDQKEHGWSDYTLVI